MKTIYPITWIDCISCATIVKNKSLKLNGILACFVDIENKTVTYDFDESVVTEEQINSMLKQYGYSIILKTDTSSEQSWSNNLHASVERRNLMISIPLVAIALVDMIWMIGWNYWRWPKMSETLSNLFHHFLPIAATIMLFMVGPKYLSAVKRYFSNGTASMDTLVWLGTVIAYVYSFIVSAFDEVLSMYINTETVYYEAVIVVIGFIALGKYLEHRTMTKSGEAIKALLTLQAKKAIRIDADGNEIEIDIEQLQINDLIRIKSGEKIPLDCFIEKGSADVDESMITGESVSVSKSVGDQLIGGTINLNGSLVGKISTTSKESYLSKIISVVTQAQQSRPSIQALVDQIMNWFVPVVLCIAIGAALFWIFFGKHLVGNEYVSLAVASFIGVLVIACPCGIWLATPMAVTTGVWHLAKNGILSKNAEWLLKLRKATRFLFDKTGTLTQWKPQVVAEEFFWDKQTIATLLYALESLANHPLADAVSKHYHAYKSQDMQVQDFWIIVWAGVIGSINSQRYIAASPTYLIEQWYKIDAHKISTLTSQAMTPICLVDEKQVLAILGIADTIKQEAIDAVKYLQNTCKEVIMISWDHPDVVANIANKLWITNYYAGVKPEEKAELVRKISGKQENKTNDCKDSCCPPKNQNIKNNDFIVMVWDGINDAPALAQADIGIAMSTGTDIAIESADMTLLHGDISKLIKAIEISKLTHSAIIQNLFRAFSYNIIGIPLAAGAFYIPFGILLNPAFEGAAMAMSDLTVIANSIRLQRKKI